MTQQKKISEANSFSGIIPMAGIDGSKIRKLREDKGLTQLYLSTVVGVTTDTISRWENKRYPTIKLENAEKLAQVLQVELEDIIEDEKTVSEYKIPGNQMKKEGNSKRTPVIPPIRIRWFLTGGIALISALLLWILYPEPLHPVVTAKRTLPLHVPPGQSFPVFIQVSSPEMSPVVSLILKEVIPPESIAQEGIPVFTAVDPEKNILKWIIRTTAKETVFTYMVQVPGNTRPQEKLSFSGYVTLKQESGNQENISGSDTISIDYYHWADANRDNRIDDEEILAVYDRFSEIPKLPINIDMIDDIWAGNGYYWDREKMMYVLKK